MLPSGATAGPSVRPPWIGAERVNSSSSFAPGGTMGFPVCAVPERAIPRTKVAVAANRYISPPFLDAEWRSVVSVGAGARPSRPEGGVGSGEDLLHDAGLVDRRQLFSKAVLLDEESVVAESQ